MGSASPPKRMTRARAAAAAAAASPTALNPKTTKSDRVTKSTKATKATKATTATPASTSTATAATAASTKRAAAVKKSTAMRAATKTAAKTDINTIGAATTSPDTTASTATAATTTSTKKAATTDKSVATKKPAAAKKYTATRTATRAAKTATKPTAAATKSTSTDTTTSNTTTSTVTKKRKLRSFDNDEEDDLSKEDNTENTMSQPAKKPRGRPKRAPTGTVTTVYATEPTPGLKSAVSRPASRVTGTLKKTVTFEEPEKENMLPGVATKAKTEATETTVTGMRAKPIRRPAASGRTTRASARAATADVTEKKPLSPRKDVQNRPLSRDAGSDDELATYEKTPLKPLMKSPVKPPTGVRKLELPPSEKDKGGNSPTPQSAEPAFTSVLNSPARRPPSSPSKNMMMSPAKRVGPLCGLFGSSAGANENIAESPTKPAMLQSPAKRPHALQAFQFNQEPAGPSRSPLKTSLLGTPAKRPPSPMKLLGAPIPRVEDKPQEPSKDNTPNPLEDIGEGKPTPQVEEKPHEALEDNTPSSVEEISEEELQAQIRLESIQEAGDEDSLSLASPTAKLESPSPQLEFPGRLSAVLPRYADPVLNPSPLAVDEAPKDEASVEVPAAAKDQDNTVLSESMPATPAPPPPPIFKSTERKITGVAARAASRAIRSVQLGAWRASSPMKVPQSHKKPASQSADTEDSEDEFSLLDENDFPVVETSAAKGFFDDEMKIRDDMEAEAAIAAMEALVEADIEAKFAKHDYQDFRITTEDLEMMISEDLDTPNADLSVIAEESGTSLINTPEGEKPQSRAESVSAASQEYGDENAVPIDPALFGNGTDATLSNKNPVTPKRPFAPREFHTVSKVPLKRADDSPLHSPKRHCSSASKATSRHPGTPARAARVDLDPTLLRGAIVFVDVHTTEGADAGRIFVDLLVQMGARCVKSWPWNPATTMDAKVDVSKVGITHVVFKDGGKRTLEKVNESNGVVQCVGVSWVLDCEKENRWVDEKDYRVDTSLIPRGGHNRRKSMEPKVVANMNGTLVTPVKVVSGFGREPQTVPNNYMSRRDSSLWMRSPSEHDDDEEDAPSEPSEMDWESTNAPVLTPFPQTPAPEAVARFALDVTPGTPTGSFESTLGNNKLLMQTCPPKSSKLIDMDEGLPNRGQDQTVMMRLMAARRKSMQFAPKVASPLKKQWK